MAKDIRPFHVRYKAGSDRSILSGLHGRFETMEEAEAAMQRCAQFFGGGKKNEQGMIVGRAIIGIVVDQAALRIQQEQDGVGDDLKADFVEEEVSELEKLRAENARLKAKLGDDECEEPYEPSDDETPKPAKSRKSRLTSSTTDQ